MRRRDIRAEVWIRVESQSPFPCRRTYGVYAPKADGEPEFFPFRAGDLGVPKAVERVAQRVPAMLKRRGLEQGLGDGEDSDKLVREDPWLAGVYARLRYGPDRNGTTDGALCNREIAVSCPNRS
jgi:hypothetical protein